MEPSRDDVDHVLSVASDGDMGMAKCRVVEKRRTLQDKRNPSHQEGMKYWLVRSAGMERTAPCGLGFSGFI